MRIVAHLVLLIFGFTIMASPGFARVRPRKKPVEPESGVYLYSLTTGAILYVDGVKKRVIPTEGLIPLSPGTHTLKLMRRGFAQRTEVVELAPGQELELEWDLVPFAGVVRIESNVEKATLWLNGKPFGAIPFDGEIPMGKHSLKAVAPGFKAAERNMEIIAGNEYSFRFDMIAEPVQRVSEGSQGGLLGKWWFWSAAGVVIGLGVAAGIVMASRQEPETPPDPDATLVW